MFIIENEVKAKKSARALEKFLAKQGVTVVHGHALNAIAAMAGYLDWNSFHATLAPVAGRAEVPVPAPAATKAFSVLDVDFGRVSQVRAFGTDYTVEPLDAYNMVLPWLANWDNSENPYLGRNPKVMRLVSMNEDSYCSETLTLAELLAFKWDSVSRQFVNPQGQSFRPLELTSFAFAQAPVAGCAEVPVPAPAATKAFSVLDVDFTQVTGLSRGDDSFWVDARPYAEALAWLPDWNNQANPNDSGVPVLDLTYLQDEELMCHAEVFADELRALVWDSSSQAFVNPDGVVYRFVVAQPVGPSLPRASAV